MEKLKLKHLAGYLPYRLKYKDERYSKISEMLVLDEFNVGSGSFFSPISKVKPILRPLSDLTKEIEVNGEKFIPKSKLNFKKSGIENIIKFGYESWHLTYIKAEKLLEWHFDIYGLIEKGLAIDINELKPQP